MTPGRKVLDVGCGNGRYVVALKKVSVDAVGCDLSVGMLTGELNGGSGVIAGDASRLPFPASMFDVVPAPHMLYHVADRARAAAEFRRVLVDSGRCVAVTNGAGHLASLRRLVEDAATAIQPSWTWVNPLSSAFSLENGAEQFVSAFDDLRYVRPDWPGQAVVTDAKSDR